MKGTARKIGLVAGTLLLIGTAVSAAPSEAVIDELDEFRWTISAADVYTKPDDGAEVLRRVEPRMELNVTGVVRATRWLRVAMDDGSIGYLNLSKAVLSDPAPAPQMDRVYRVIRRANMRSGPGVSYRVMRRLERGDEVRVAGRSSRTQWLRVQLDRGKYVIERVGYVIESSLKEMPRGFRDCEECPLMVVVPPGSYMMGSPESEPIRNDDEGPQHRVIIPKTFAVGVYEVTRGEFAEFVLETGYGFDFEWVRCTITGEDEAGAIERQQSDEHPACVKWDDAQAYVKWLSERSGNEYRLLSEAEWEYVARAGTSTSRYWDTYWGGADRGQCRNANGADRGSGFEFGMRCDDGYATTAPVGSFERNAFGLHDVLGNLWEWTQDCWNESYAGAPTDGSAWESGDCGHRVARGGSWGHLLRSANRAKFNGYVYIGIRVARTF